MRGEDLLRLLLVQYGIVPELGLITGLPLGVLLVGLGRDELDLGTHWTSPHLTIDGWTGVAERNRSTGILRTVNRGRAVGRPG